MTRRLPRCRISALRLPFRHGDELDELAQAAGDIAEFET